jgi:hypothetical protein
MSRPRTLFVLGAGSSAEAGLPTGAGLIAKIRDLVDLQFDYSDRRTSGDPAIVDALARLGRAEGNRTNDYYRAARRLRDGVTLSTSIDTFIDRHRDDNELKVCGKLAIVRAILHEERKSKLFRDAHSALSVHRFDPVATSWFPQTTAETSSKDKLPNCSMAPAATSTPTF